ncbi:hypothetical protein PYW07_010013 [Mythimna separata]|uniref:Uncharacterized protein n=1 Tax=Mythimna separata TaxID=271217 RepID=A0AAD8DPZ5_MYTSE|nr:hypothetical protein PYW07_010013 [Mythimna separata]
MYIVFSNDLSKTKNVRTKNHFRHCNNKLFLFLLAVVFLSILNEGVKGKIISPVTQRPTHIAQESALTNGQPGRRQESLLDMTGRTKDDQGRGAALARFSTPKPKKTKRRRTTMWFESAVDQCDYLALTCLRAYQTGKVCAKTANYYYFTFKNYCMMDYANCAARFDLWQAIHMNDCINLKLRSSHLQMSEQSSKIMEGIYMVEQDFGL